MGSLYSVHSATAATSKLLSTRRLPYTCIYVNTDIFTVDAHMYA